MTEREWDRQTDALVALLSGLLVGTVTTVLVLGGMVCPATRSRGQALFTPFELTRQGLAARVNVVYVPLGGSPVLAREMGLVLSVVLLLCFEVEEEEQRTPCSPLPEVLVVVALRG
jgi:hypothetical protein